MSSLLFVEITDVDSAAFHQAMEIYVSAFPANERHSEDTIRERVKRAANRLIITMEGERVVFMALLWPLKNTPFVLLDYLAVAPEHRGQGLGSTFLQHLTKQLEHNNQALLIETEDPDFGENKEERQRRISFYQRSGAALLENVQYILPPLQGGSHTEMKLMVLPASAKNDLTTEKLKHLIIQLYAELYNRNVNDRYLQSILSQLK